MFFDISLLFSLFVFFNLLIKTNFTKNSILVALYIVGAFILSGIIYLLVDFTVLGVILILVYVGAVVVLFLFVTIIMPLRTIYLYYNIFSYFFNYVLWFFFLVFFFSHFIDLFPYYTFFSREFSLFYLLSIMLYLDKIWYFLLAAFLLTVSIIGAISITQTKLGFNTFKESINVQLSRNYKADINMYN